MPKRSSSVIAASVSSQKLFDANGGRDRFVVQNQDSSATCYVNVDLPAAVGGGNLMIPPRCLLELSGFVGAVYLISDVGTPAICAWEV